MCTSKPFNAAFNSSIPIEPSWSTSISRNINSKFFLHPAGSTVANWTIFFHAIDPSLVASAESKLSKNSPNLSFLTTATSPPSSASITLTEPNTFSNQDCCRSPDSSISSICSHAHNCGSVKPLLRSLGSTISMMTSNIADASSPSSSSPSSPPI